jgi:CheY-like chemotaxis protein
MDLNSYTFKILVIEDADLDTFIFRNVVKRVVSNFSIISCNNGEDAINKLLELRDNDLLPDFIFLDLTMPAMDGFEFLDSYNQLNIDSLSKIKIYILSSSVSSADIKKAYSNKNVEGFLTKPLSLEQTEAIFKANKQDS